MANECTLLVETQQPINFTSATAMEKGTVCKLTSPMTAAASDGDTDAVAGILKTETRSTDTSAAVYRGGIFRGVAGVAGVTAGQAIITDSSTSAPNRLVNADVNSEHIVGIALQTATSGNSFVFELKPMAVNLA